MASKKAHAAKPKAKTKPTTSKLKRPASRPKAAAAKPKAVPGGRIAAAVERLVAWASSGKGQVDAAAPRNDAKARLNAPQPEWGKVKWALPPSYAAFLAQASRFEISWGDEEWPKGFVVLDAAEMKETGGIVYMPDDVSRDEGVYLSTNHLVPFASGGNDECAFCFDVTKPTTAGEYPVYFHHQDEPRTRLVKTGAWEDPKSATPDFPDFTTWLEWVAAELSAEREPANSRPSAFHGMPGRKR